MLCIELQSSENRENRSALVLRARQGSPSRADRRPETRLSPGELSRPKTPSHTHTHTHIHTQYKRSMCSQIGRHSDKEQMQGLLIATHCHSTAGPVCYMRVWLCPASVPPLFLYPCSCFIPMLSYEMKVSDNDTLQLPRVN